MNKCSKKNAAKDRAYRKACPLKGQVCVFCGLPATEVHHAYEQSKWPELDTEGLNLFPVERVCHEMCTAHPESSRVLLRAKFPARMAELDVLSKTVGKVNGLRLLTEGAA